MVHTLAGVAGACFIRTPDDVLIARDYWPIRRNSNALNMDSATGLKTPANMPRVRLLSGWLAIASWGPWLQRLSASAGTFGTSLALRVRRRPLVSSAASSVIVPYDGTLSKDDRSGTTFGLLPSYSPLPRDISELYNNIQSRNSITTNNNATTPTCLFPSVWKHRAKTSAKSCLTLCRLC